MPFGVLKHFHPMIGYDLHVVMPPGSPTPIAPGPHIAMSALMGIGATAQMGPTETTHFGWTILRGSDIGPLIPHAPLVPNCLLPLILLASASKSHFGSSKYLVQNKPVAAALLVVVNPNLNCADPVPLPLDGVLAITAHFVDMTLGDILSGLAHMAIDAAIGALLNWAGSKLFGGLSQRLYENALFRPMMAMFERMGWGRVSVWLLQHDFQEMMAKGFFAKLGQIVGADFLGSPLGYSFPVNAFGAGDQAAGRAATPGSDRGGMEEAHDALQRYIDGPGAESHDVPPSPDAGAGGGTGGPPDAGTGGSGGDAPDAGTGGSGGDASGAGTGGDAGGPPSAGTGGSGGDAGTGGDAGGPPSAGTGGSGGDASGAGTGGDAGSPPSAGTGGSSSSGAPTSDPAASPSSSPTSTSPTSTPSDQGGVCSPDSPEGSGGTGGTGNP